MYQSEKLADNAAVQSMKKAYLSHLISPMHAYWEDGLIGSSPHYLLTRENNIIGYFVLQGATLMQLHLEEGFIHVGGEVMSYLFKEFTLENALAATIEPLYLSLCLDKQKSVENHSFLFEDHLIIDPVWPGRETTLFREATQDDFQAICDHYTRTSDDGELSLDNLKAYIQSVLNHHHVFLLYADGQLIATSECRISKTQAPFADLGMIVHPDFRRRGVGSYILMKGKQYCYQQNTKPICCCEVTNLGSKRAIEKAGFAARHRVLSITF